MKRIVCSYQGHRMIQVLPDLWLCEDAAYGALADRKGAVEEARAMVAKAGGIARMRDDVEAAEQKRREERQKARREQAEALREGIRRR